MAIAFNCPHCQKAYKLKDNMAGKKVTCAATNCRKVFVVPAPVATKMPPAGLANADDYAAAALMDEPDPKVEEKVPELASVAVKCPHCDFENLFEGRMAGKNAPCKNDECRKIIKVPVLEKIGPKDWRKTGKEVPSLARRDTEPGLEGAWGNTEVTAVSREALVGAEAVGAPVEEEEGTNWRRRFIRIALALGVVGLLVTGTLYGMNWWERRQEKKTMETALALTEKPEELKLRSEHAGLILWLAAIQDQDQNRWEESKNRLEAARGKFMSDVPEKSDVPENSLLLLEISLQMAEAIGTKAEVEKDQRLDWDKAKLSGSIRPTLQKLPGSTEDDRDLRCLAMRALVRKMSARDQFQGCVNIANQICTTDRSEVFAAMGLEMLSLGQRDRAWELAQQASQNTPEFLEQSPSLIALWLALASPDAPPEKIKEAENQAKAIAAPPARDSVLTPTIRIGYAEGWARQGKLEQARTLAGATGGRPEDRLRARVAVTAALAETKTGDASDLEACAAQLDRDFKDKPAPQWLMWKLVLVSLKAGRADLAHRFAQAISDAGLKAFAQLEMLRAKLQEAQSKKTPADFNQAADVGSPNDLAHALAWMEIARHNTRVSGTSAVFKEVKRWSEEREKWKPFALAGIALAGHTGTP